MTRAGFSQMLTVLDSSFSGYEIDCIFDLVDTDKSNSI